MPNLENDIKAHARAHVKDLTARTTELVGEVIAKGMLGILEECIAMHVRIGELEAALATRQSSTQGSVPVDWRAEFIAQAAEEQGFVRSQSCCNVPHKYCSTDAWKGNLEGFSRALVRIATRQSSADAADAAQYLKEGETLLQRLKREIRDSEALNALLAKERARFQFLHSTNKDADGWEWGVARIRVADDGRVEYLWGVSDHSDIDAAIAAQGGKGGAG